MQISSLQKNSFFYHFKNFHKKTIDNINNSYLLYYLKLFEIYRCNISI